MYRQLLIGGSCLLLMAVVALRASAANEEPQQPQKTANGIIAAVAQDLSTFTLQMGQAEQSAKRVLKISGSTSFQLNGQASTAAEALKVGNHASVKYTGDTALSVSVTTQKKEKQPGQGDKNKPNGSKGKKNHQSTVNH
jgi:hypothetical protein